MSAPIIVDRRTSTLASADAASKPKVIDILEWAKSKATSDARASRYLLRLEEASR